MNKFTKYFSIYDDAEKTLKKLYMASLRYRIQGILAIIIGECLSCYYIYTLYIKGSLYVYLLIQGIGSIGLVGIVGIVGLYFYFTSIRLNGSICIVQKGFRTIKIEDFTVTKKGGFDFLGELITVYIISGRERETKIYCLNGSAKIYLDELSDIAQET